MMEKLMMVMFGMKIAYLKEEKTGTIHFGKVLKIGTILGIN